MLGPAGLVKRRYEKAINDAQAVKEANVKERRQFAVHSIGSFLRIAEYVAFGAALWYGSVPWTGADEVAVSSGEFRLPYYPDTATYYSRGVEIALVTSERGSALNVRLSRLAAVSNLPGRDNSAAVAWGVTLRNMLGQPGEKVTGLVEVFRQLGRNDLADVGILPWQQQPFFCDLLSLIVQRGFSPLAPSDQFAALVEKYPRPPLLRELRVKPYLARSDERAYVIDHDAFSNLVGSALHRILVPGSIALRRTLPANRVNPATGKNLIDKFVFVPYGMVLAIAVSDTSAFTSSGVNLWVGLFAFLLSLDLPKTACRVAGSIILRVQGHLLHCTIVELIQIYLWLSVGTKCRDTVTGEDYTSQGGYLGVTCNITLALLAQSYYLDYLREKLTSELRLDVEAQSGGDDVYSHYVGDERAVRLALREAHEGLTKYVGAQKEFTVAFARPEVTPASKHDTGLTFCKKSLLIEEVFRDAEGVFYKIESLYDVPVLEELFADRPQSVKEASWRYSSFNRSVHSATRPLLNPDRVRDTLLALYVRKHNDPLALHVPLLVKRSQVLLTESDYSERAGVCATAKAWQVAERVPEVRHSVSTVLNASLTEKIAQLASQGVLFMLECDVGNEKKRVWCLKREFRKLRRVKDVEAAVVLQADWGEELDKLTEMLS